MIRNVLLDSVAGRDVCVCVGVGGGGGDTVMLCSSHFVFSSPAACRGNDKRRTTRSSVEGLCVCVCGRGGEYGDVVFFTLCLQLSSGLLIE